MYNNNTTYKYIYKLMIIIVIEVIKIVLRFDNYNYTVAPYLDKLYCTMYSV